MYTVSILQAKTDSEIQDIATLAEGISILLQSSEKHRLITW